MIRQLLRRVAPSDGKFHIVVRICISDTQPMFVRRFCRRSNIGSLRNKEKQQCNATNRLRSIHQQLKPKQGHAFSVDSKRVILFVLVTSFLMQIDANPGSYCDPTVVPIHFHNTSQTCCISNNTLKKLWSEFTLNGDQIPDTKHRGRKPASTVYAGDQLAGEHLSKLEEWVLDMNLNLGGVTSAKLQLKFVEVFNLNVRKPLIRRVLKRLGYAWGSAKKVNQKLRKCASRSAFWSILNTVRTVELISHDIVVARVCV
jgi:hypothetical protein